MKDDNITKFEPNPDHPPTLTPEQRARLDAMTDAEVEAAALADPDAQPLTEEELARFERVPNVKAIRERLGLTQSSFAALMGVSSRTLQNWEQGRREPEGPAKALLRVVDREPQAVLHALHA